MTEPRFKPADKPALTREARLAQRLRENLRLRKAQARALGAAADDDAAGDDPPAHS